MINLFEYFDIDWETTSKNINDLFSGTVSYEAFSEAIHVTSKTVYN